jgi:hypothetical protein
MFCYTLVNCFIIGSCIACRLDHFRKAVIMLGYSFIIRCCVAC